MNYSWYGIWLACLLVHATRAVDFDRSMQCEKFPAPIAHEGNKRRLDFFKELYYKHNPEQYAQEASIARIPHIIHHIWLGKKMPAEYEVYRKSWIQHHPEWLFIFWADSPINFDQGEIVITSFDELTEWINTPDKNTRMCVVDVRSLVFDNRPFYDQAKNYGEKSDILKWEIVYRYGGVYVDTDFECLRSVDFFHSAYDFYTGIQPLDTGCVQLGAALYGATPGHPILKRCVEDIKRNQHIQQIVLKTGPLHFTRCFLMQAGRGDSRDIALPAGYLYPCGYEQRGLKRAVWEQPESYAVHHWAGSWLKPEGFER